MKHGSVVPPARILVIEDNAADVFLLGRALDKQARRFELTSLADGNAGEMLGAPDLAKNVFPVAIGQVQVHQDQVWDCRIRIGAFPANECEGGTPVGQRGQFKPSSLLAQSPPEKEDIRSVVFNDENAGRRKNRTVFQAHSPSGTHLRPVLIIPQLMVAPPAVTPVLPLRSIAGAPGRRSRKGNR